ncbi:MAG: hypothetical protein ABL967_03060 [Bryobacteraceae bacterium]
MKFALGCLFAISAAQFSLLMAADAASSAPPASRNITFTKDIAPIFQERCQECHHKDSLAPMSLMTYEETRPWAKAIKDRVVRRQMPPWHIDMHVGVGKFKNDMSLTDEQIAMIAKWVDSGAPQGDPKEMPPAKVWPEANEWKGAKELGQPDLVVESAPYTMPARHQDVWWRPTTNITGVDEPRWVRAVEIRPTHLQGRKITHHAIAYLVQDETDNLAPGTDPALNARAYLMEWAIGKGYDLFRPGTGKLLLPGSQLSWDIHLHATGEDIRDSVQIAMWLYPKGQKPEHRTYLTGFQALRGFVNSRATGGERNVDIPPNTMTVADNYTVLKQAARLENFQPHMHLRGKAMAVDAILPDGSIQNISYVGNFNFNWMTNYIYADDAAPVLPKGTTIHVTAWYDNTKNNPFNPDPDQWVGFGDRTVDEMGHAWMNVTYVSDEEYAAELAKQKKMQASR